MYSFRSCCERINEKGQGVGKDASGKLVFASNWLPGEFAWLVPLQTRATYIVAQVKKLENLSPQRVKPFCSHFSKCGGCQLQHMNLDTQRQFKIDLFASYYETLGQQRPALTWIDGPLQGYRTKLILPIQWSEDSDKPSVGFFQTHSNQMEVLTGCAIHTAALEKVIQQAPTWLYKWSQSWKHILTDKNETPWKAVHFIYARQTAENSKVHLALGTRLALSWLNWSQCLMDFASLDLDVHGISSILQTKENNVWLDGLIEREQGPLWMTIDEQNYQLDVDPFAFQQVNPSVAKKIREQIISWIKQIQPNRFLELYCGAGNLANAIALSSDVEVIGVDNLQANIDSARSNAQKIGSKAEFICEDALSWVMQDKTSSWPVWMVNPPRKGLGENLTKLILEQGPEFLIYMACGQKAFVKDTQALQNLYELKSLQGYEMFAQTVHFETLSLWQRRS